MSKLTELIEDIEEGKIETRNIKDVKGLLSSLNELNNMIGHKKIKDSISKQVRYLIQMLNDPYRQQEVMLNTVLYGPPGIGKTTIGIYLSKIWNCLGYLKQPNIISTINKLIPTSSIEERVEMITYVLIGFYTLSSVLIIIGKKIFNKFGVKAVIVYTITIVAVALIILFSLYRYLFDNKIVLKIKDHDVFRIVSRSEFVSEYLGQTAIKTLNLLKENMGKVLFIDEAYSLYEGKDDPYGMEALTTLNKFLSEHPRDIIVIFAGYKDMMKNTIFKVQQGLERRCMWVFDCEPYTPDELFEIFKKQLTGSGWKIKESDKDAILKLFRENYEYFSSFGGDTEKLCNFAKIEHCDKKKENFLIDESDVKRGLIRLKNNRATKV